MGPWRWRCSSQFALWPSFHAALLAVTLGVAPLALTGDLLHWINDGLMAVFFLLVGLEIKRECSG
jgi:NhaA family Na+:H+ antiporter